MDSASIRGSNVGRIRDVAVDESVVLLAFVLSEILADAGVGQLVEVDDLRVLPIFVEQKSDEIRSDEAGAAGDEVAHTAREFILGAVDDLLGPRPPARRLRPD